jgi:hypothetical protein
VPSKYEQDSSLGIWVRTQRSTNSNNKLRLDRKERLEEIGFAWKACSLAAPSSPMNVRGPLVIGSFHALGTHVSHSHRSFSGFFCVEFGFGVGSVYQ